MGLEQHMGLQMPSVSVPSWGESRSQKSAVCFAQPLHFVEHFLRIHGHDFGHECGGGSRRQHEAFLQRIAAHHVGHVF